MGAWACWVYGVLLLCVCCFNGDDETGSGAYPDENEDAGVGAVDSGEEALEKNDDDDVAKNGEGGGVDVGCANAATLGDAILREARAFAADWNALFTGEPGTLPFSS